MNRKTALEIVLDLAREHKMDEDDSLVDGDYYLTQKAKKQEEAITIVEQILDENNK